MAYSKESLNTVVAMVIGTPQREALGLPRATEEAALSLFLHAAPKQSEVSVIREALGDLRRVGSFQFSEG